MHFAKVINTSASITKHASLNGSKLLIVARLDENYRSTVHVQVVVDTIGAGNGEIVIITTGSSMRMSNNKDHPAIDAAVVGIVGLLEFNDQQRRVRQGILMFVNEISFDNWINEAIAMQLPEFRMPLSLEDSELPTKLVREIVQSSNMSIVFSLVDTCGQQRFFFSMDNTLLVSHILASQRAWTAITLKMSIHELATPVQPSGDLYGPEKEKGIRCFGGGFSCRSGRRLLGGTGISGDSVEGDMPIVRQVTAQFSALRYPLITTR